MSVPCPRVSRQGPVEGDQGLAPHLPRAYGALADHVRTVYDGRGLAIRTTTPRLVSGSGGAFLEAEWLSTTPAATQTTYDDLRRPRVSTLPDGRRTEQRYDGWSSEQYDAAGRNRRTERDWAGRTVQVQEFTGRGIFGRSGGYEGSWTLYASTSYRFDLLDRLVEVADAAGNRTSLSYDALGRKTRLVDPDMGTWNYEYDPLGTLRAQTDARGQRIEFFYDALKREVRRWHALAWTSPSPRQPSVHDLMELRAAVDTDARAAG